jgi:hypothetical protein
MILKDQPSKLKKLQRSKEKKKRTPERLAPSRAFTACNCLQYTPHTTWSYSNGAGYTFNVVRPNVPCECPRYTPTLPAKKPDPVRRNPGRMDGLRWNGSSFICSSSIDARTTYDIIDDCDIGEWDVDLEEQEEKLSNATFSVSLLDIARPAKPRGIAKHFEVVERLPRVIALEETDDFGWEKEDEDWEDLYGDEWLPLQKQRRAYSDIVREN